MFSFVIFFILIFYFQKSGKESHILVTYIAGNGLKKMFGKTSKEIVDACMKVLYKLFPEQVSWNI